MLEMTVAVAKVTDSAIRHFRLLAYIYSAFTTHLFLGRDYV